MNIDSKAMFLNLRNSIGIKQFRAFYIKMQKNIKEGHGYVSILPSGVVVESSAEQFKIIKDIAYPNSK